MFSFSFFFIYHIWGYIDDPENEYIGSKAIAAGWGTLKEEGKPSCLLQEVEVPVMSLQDCRNTSYSPRMISDNMLCAGYPDGMKDSCQVMINIIFSFTSMTKLPYKKKKKKNK